MATKLQSAWCLWFVSATSPPTLEWTERLGRVMTFDTVEGFWALFNSIVPPTALGTSAEMYLFKEGAYPSYEANPEGGIWSASFQRRPDVAARVQDAWLLLAMSLVGETMDDGQDIAGCVVSVKRNHYRVSVWTSTASEEELQRRIGLRMRAVLDLPAAAELQYRPNRQTSESTQRRLSQTSKVLTV